MTNDKRLDLMGRAAVAAAWLGLFTAFLALIWREVGPERAVGLAMAVTTVTAVAAHLTVTLHDRLPSPWRWAAMGCAVLVSASLGHAVFVRLGMDQSWGQDALNLTITSGIALAVRLAWAGFRTRRILEDEVRRRHEAEARLEAARQAGERPNGPVEVKVGHGRTMLDPTTVLLMEADGNFARIVTDTGEVFASEPLKVLADRLAPWGLVRVHKSFVVNRARVRSRGADGLVLTDGRKVPVGRAHRRAMD